MNNRNLFRVDCVPNQAHKCTKSPTNAPVIEESRRDKLLQEIVNISIFLSQTQSRDSGKGSRCHGCCSTNSYLKSRGQHPSAQVLTVTYIKAHSYKSVTRKLFFSIEVEQYELTQKDTSNTVTMGVLQHSI